MLVSGHLIRRAIRYGDPNRKLIELLTGRASGFDGGSARLEDRSKFLIQARLKVSWPGLTLFPLAAEQSLRPRAIFA